MINLYEKYLKNESRKKNIFILTAENRLALRNIPFLRSFIEIPELF